MSNKSVSNWLFLFATTALVVGCNYRVDKTASSNPATEGQKPGASVADFATVKAEVLQPKCLRCHDGSEESDLREYALVKAALTEIRDRVTRTDAKRMPKRDSLTPEQMNLLLTWIDAGGPEVGSENPQPESTPLPAPGPGPGPSATPEPMPTPTPGPQPLPLPADTPSFAFVLEKVLQPRCAKCHSADSDDLFSIADYKATSTFAADIVRRINLPEGDRQRMPRKEIMSKEEIALIEAWVNGGAPNESPIPAPTPFPSATPSATPVVTPTPAPEILPTYSSINEKIFTAHACLKCHTGGDDGEAHYNMNSLATIVRDDADAITRRDPVSSKLVKSVTRTDNKRMPKGRRPPLAPEEIEVLKRWIELGSPP